ncbi:hypothetical protein CONCODRAFT_85666 [Conidiobolus coronatus NRRL 28638]|uniref:Zn(2)-C6 fungal-type domain-containing protein n=1 Tax=Conidiobolus coronatus (strain ATCC 28846 / CBS 209.66 / NRRL 28638) TaxID=796925 RepID=A0A137P4C0_CONC2|nr:hypothetical protein CONCODRAFT_85666 [Conidiobolus coronatus NRRL 28638]|eukprot:KXN69868.1 hypothetical protein CONCODRAFT_85666 [Conidiobolus coronatus NRRL 28638]
MSSVPCNNCRRSKKKCDRGSPCSRCSLQKVECVYNKINPYKRRNTTKVAKIFDRADKLEALLKEALKKDYKFDNLNLNHIIDHWNSIKLEMTDYNDLNLPISLAWYKIEGSIPNIVAKASTLVKSPSNYQDHLILYNIYITYLHPHFPFINPQKILLLLELAQYDNPLLTSTLCRAQLFWFAMNNYDIPNLEEMELYRMTIRENSKNETNINLEVVQTNINLVLLEAHRYEVASINKHLTSAVYKGHQLGLHDLQSVIIDEEYEEKECAWSLLTWLDFLLHVMLSQPRLIKINLSLHLDSCPSPISYDKDRIFYSASSYIMKRYESCVKLSWDFPKNRKEYHPEKTNESTILHLIEMLSRAQTFVDMNVDYELVKEPNTTGSTASIWRLAQFLKICMLIIDVCQILNRHYQNQVEIKQKYFKIQHEYSVKLIEAMFPQLVDPSATNIQYFEFIDPLYPIASFHACKILLEDNAAISKEYFGYSYKLCVESYKLFKCNWKMVKFFQQFEGHPYLIQLNKELEAPKHYLSPSPSSSNSSVDL